MPRNVMPKLMSFKSTAVVVDKTFEISAKEADFSADTPKSRAASPAIALATDDAGSVTHIRMRTGFCNTAVLFTLFVHSTV